MEGPIKAKTTATLRLETSGEVFGEVVNECGKVVSLRHFGVMTEDAFRTCLMLIEKALLETPRVSTDW